MSNRTLVAGVLLGVFALLLPQAATAQDERRFEAFGNFSYLFADVGGSGFQDNASGIGFHGGGAFFLNDWLGLGGEVGYNSGDLDVPVIEIFPRPEVDFSQWTLLFGPRFRIADSGDFRVGAQAMAGIAHGSADVEFGDDGIIFNVPGFGPRRFEFGGNGFGFGDTVFAALFGVHFDLRVHDRVLWRVVEPDLLITNYGNDGQAHFRLSSGLVFEF